MSAVTATLAGRRAAEALMVDACTIKHKTGETADPETGATTPAYSMVYSGKCRVQQRVPVAKPSDVGEAALWLERLQLQVPMSVVGISSNDLVTITASALDPDLVGRVFHARELGHKTHMTARRFQIEEVTG